MRELDQKKKEVEELKKNTNLDQEINYQLSEKTRELKSLKQTHQEVKAWGEFKEREVDQRTRHLVNVKNKMRDEELANKRLRQIIEGHTKEIADLKIQKVYLENENKASQVAAETHKKSLETWQTWYWGQQAQGGQRAWGAGI